MNKLPPVKIEIIVQIEFMFLANLFFCISRVVEQLSGII